MAGEFVLGALRHTWEALQQLGVSGAVIGGLAISRWGHTRFTKDVDLLIAIDPPLSDAVLQTLQDAGLSLRRLPPVVQVGNHRFMQFTYTPRGRYETIAVDVLFADSDFLRSALARATPLIEPAANLDVRVVSCEDLILLKLQADRVLDHADAVRLLQYNRANLDFAYLSQWLSVLQLQKEWLRSWSEAFPDEPPPA